MDHREEGRTPLVYFVIPVRNQASLADWKPVKENLAKTLASIAGQTIATWECRLVANPGADLPELPDGCVTRWVDLPYVPLPDRDLDREKFYDAIRHDKGLRIHEGIRDIPPSSYVMAVDYDDFVHRGLVEFVARNVSAPGWYFPRGYQYDGGRLLRLAYLFNLRCGTSHIIRRDLLGRFETDAGGLDIAAVQRRIGSHIFIDADLEREGTPLMPLPFVGSVYRVGHAQSIIMSKRLTPSLGPLLRHPIRTLRRLRAYRLLTARLIRDYSLKP